MPGIPTIAIADKHSTEPLWFYRTTPLPWGGGVVYSMSSTAASPCPRRRKVPSHHALVSNRASLHVYRRYKTKCETLSVVVEKLYRIMSINQFSIK